MSDYNGQNGWPLVALDDLCERKIAVRDLRARPDEAFVYVDISSVDNKRKQIVNAQRLLGRDASSRARQIILERDVLVATTRPNLNAVAIVPQEFHNQIASTGFCVLRPSNKLDPEYLFSFVQSWDFVRRLSDLVKGALYPAVTERQVRAQKIPLPPLDEQRRIAARLREQLSILAKARSALEAQLTAAESLPAAHLRAVFESEEAKQWPRRRIEDFAETGSGTTPPRGNREYYGGKIPWVKTGELKDGVIEDTEEHISEAALRDLSLKLFPEKTLLIAMYGQGQTRGRTGLLGVPATTNQACFAILPNRNFDSQFMQFWFQFSYERLRRETEGRGGNQPNLNGVILNRLSAPLPPAEGQNAITAKLDAALTMTAEMQRALRSKLSELEKLPATLLRAAFSLAGEGDLESFRG